MYKQFGYSEREKVLNKLWHIYCMTYLKENLQSVKTYLRITEKIKAGKFAYIKWVNLNKLYSVVEAYECIGTFIKQYPYNFHNELLCGCSSLKELMSQLSPLLNIKLISVYLTRSDYKNISYDKLSLNFYSRSILNPPSSEDVIEEAFDHIMELLGYKGHVYKDEPYAECDYYSIPMESLLEGGIWDMRVQLPLPEEITRDQECELANLCEDIIPYNQQETWMNWSFYDADEHQLGIVFDYFGKFTYSSLQRFLSLIDECKKMNMALS